MKLIDKNGRARTEILYWITQFCTTNVFGDTHRSPGMHGFYASGARVGDLILLKSAPISKWNLSWLIEIKTGSNEFNTKYLLESIETGELCWWENVMLYHLERELVEEHPRWKWTDRQYAFADRWNRVCRKEGAYIVLPIHPVFGEEYSVTLGTRTRYNWDEERPIRTFEDWRKITMADMASIYQSCVEERKAA